MPPWDAETNTIIYGLDFDKCTDRDIEDLLEEMEKAALAGKKVIFTIDSNRQDPGADDRTLSAYVHFDLMERMLKKRLEQKEAADEKGPGEYTSNIEFNRQLSADVMQGTKAGTALNEALPYLQYKTLPREIEAAGKEIGEEDNPYLTLRAACMKEALESAKAKLTDKHGPDFAFDPDIKSGNHLVALGRKRKSNADESKTSILQLKLQLFANSVKKPCVYCFYDDKADILKGVEEYFRKHPDKIPEGLTLKIVHRSSQASVVAACKSPLESLNAINAEIKALEMQQQTIPEEDLAPFKQRILDAIKALPSSEKAHIKSAQKRMLSDAETLGKISGILDSFVSIIEAPVKEYETQQKAWEEHCDEVKYSPSEAGIVGKGDIDPDPERTMLYRAAIIAHFAEQKRKELGISEEASLKGSDRKTYEGFAPDYDASLADVLEGIKRGIPQFGKDKCCLIPYSSSLGKVDEARENYDAPGVEEEVQKCLTPGVLATSFAIKRVQTIFALRAANPENYVKKGTKAFTAAFRHLAKNVPQSRQTKLEALQMVMDLLSGKKTPGLTDAHREALREGNDGVHEDFQRVMSELNEMDPDFAKMLNDFVNDSKPNWTYTVSNPATRFESAEPRTLAITAKMRYLSAKEAESALTHPDSPLEQDKAGPEATKPQPEDKAFLKHKMKYQIMRKALAYEEAVASSKKTDVKGFTKEEQAFIKKEPSLLKTKSRFQALLSEDLVKALSATNEEGEITVEPPEPKESAHI
jgi:hypothetical protein